MKIDVHWQLHILAYDTWSWSQHSDWKVWHLELISAFRLKVGWPLWWFVRCWFIRYFQKCLNATLRYRISQFCIALFWFDQLVSHLLAISRLSVHIHRPEVYEYAQAFKLECAPIRPALMRKMIDENSEEKLLKSLYNRIS